jgi:hypothetical protein
MLLQSSVHISENHTDHGDDQFEPVNVQLGRCTAAGDIRVPFKLLRAATDRQHLSEWLQTADCAATAIVTLLGSVTLRSDYISGMPKRGPKRFSVLMVLWSSHADQGGFPAMHAAEPGFYHIHPHAFFLMQVLSRTIRFLRRMMNGLNGGSQRPLSISRLGWHS